MVLSVIKYTMLHFLKEIPNIIGHPNHIFGARVTAVLLNGWNMPIGGASAAEGLRATATPSSLLNKKGMLQVLYIKARGTTLNT